MPTYVALLVGQAWILASFFLNGAGRFVAIAIGGFWLYIWWSKASEEEKRMSRYQDEVQYITLNVLVKRLTAKAVLINLGDNEGDRWVPQSCMSTATLADITEGYLGDVEIAEWFAKKEGLV